MTGALPLWPDVSDGDLARAAAEGDRQAFAEIYDRYADRLYDFCVGMLADRDAAADCVQDTFCVAATDLGSLREPERLRPWLYSITRHHAMRCLRHRYREEVSDAVPDMTSHEAGPEAVAGQSELAHLVDEAAGGLSDRDRELLELSYRHGLDGPELAETLGVSLTSANTMVFRLRQTVERCLGALLVARSARSGKDGCPELVAILKGWDGQFTVLMRKRIARHVESCNHCAQEQRRRVNPVALLGAAPMFIPAPVWLRSQTLDRVQLTSASSGIDAAGGVTGPQRVGTRIALIVGVPLVCLGATILWFARPNTPIAPLVDVGIDSTLRESPPPAPTAIATRPRPAQPAPATTAGRPIPVPTRAAPAPDVSTPGPAPEVTTPNPAPPNPAPEVNAPKPAPAATPPITTVPPGFPAPVPNPNPNVTPPWPQQPNPNVTPPAIEITPFQQPPLLITLVPPAP